MSTDKTAMMRVYDYFFNSDKEDFRQWIRDNEESLLDEEKKQIIDAYTEGQKEMIAMVETHNKKSWFTEITFDEPDSPEKYYSRTYTTK
jgi:hypothetical protein